MDYKITNVKVSIKTSPISLDNVLQLNFPVKNHNNFAVIKTKYTYSIFKTNKIFQNHINITGIPSLDKVEDSIKYLKEYLDFEIIKKPQIDNIIANLKLPHQIDLAKVCEKNLFKLMKLNTEKFPGLFVKFDKGTAILFHSGNIVLMGAKTDNDLKCLTANICAAMKML